MDVNTIPYIDPYGSRKQTVDEIKECGYSSVLLGLWLKCMVCLMKKKILNMFHFPSKISRQYNMSSTELLVVFHIKYGLHS